MSTLTFTLPCAVCNADLKDLPLGGSCPGCGRPVTDTLNFSPVDPDSMTIRSDLPCFGCGYNLRTLGAGALCPECAKPVHRSLRADRLCFADPGWLKRVRFGMTCIITFILGFVLFFVLIGAMALNTPLIPSAALMGLLTTAWLCLGLLGVRLGTTVQRPFPGKPPSIRRIAVARVNGYLVFGPLILLVYIAFPLNMSGRLDIEPWIALFLAAGIPLMLCMYWASMSRLARRGGCERLRKTALVLVIIAGLGGCCVILAVALLWAYSYLLLANYSNQPTIAPGPFTSPTPAMWFLQTAGSVMTIAAVMLALLFLVLGTVALFLYRSTISRMLESSTNEDRDETAKPE